MAEKKRRVWLALGVIVLALVTLGYDLAQLMSGRETPDDAILSAAATESNTASPPPLITSYKRFSIKVDDSVSVDVHAREVSDATANIFMVHGAGGGAWVWEEYFKQLPAMYNLYAISWRGHFTSTPVDDANIADYVNDQIAAINAITNRNDLPIHVMGHSFGGATTALVLRPVAFDAQG